MKKIFTCSFIFILISFAAEAQLFTVGYKAAFNSSTLNDAAGIRAGTRLSLPMGICFRFFSLSKNHLVSEIYYSQQGAPVDYLYAGVPSGRGARFGSSKVELNYLNLASIYMLKLDRKLFMQTGLQLGILMNGIEKGIIFGQDYYSDLQEDGNKYDGSVIFGFGVYTSRHLFLGAREQLGFTSVRKHAVQVGDFLLPQFENKVLQLSMNCYF